MDVEAVVADGLITVDAVDCDEVTITCDEFRMFGVEIAVDIVGIKGMEIEDGIVGYIVVGLCIESADKLRP